MNHVITQRQVQILSKTKFLRVGVLAHRGMDQARQMWEPTAQYLSKQIPEYNFQFEPLSFEQIYIEAATNKLNFVITNSSMYVELEILFDTLSAEATEIPE